ncbi:DUF4231 domain-containing protein [Streptomyces albus]|uniref:DUF4231 domain-containing protein n=1 Tax=Streptomyces albus TaxID=1888 RepID=UPI0006E2D4DE|nr:DUF4231 domain-containing protein [Streptomyces albus]
MGVEQGLTDADLPGIQQLADKTSLAGQASYLRLTKIRLWATVTAALCGAVGLIGALPGPVDHGLDAASLMAFIVALAAEILLLRTRPEEAWYQGRAVAESLKSLAWKYATRAQPFHDIGDEEAASLFRRKIRSVLDVLPEGVVPEPELPAQISTGMRELRAAPLSVRITAYKRGRIADQRLWYARKARFNEERSQRWRLTLLGLELAGAFGAFLLLLDLTDFDPGGLLAVLVAAGGAWLEVKQYDNLASAYALTSTELLLVEGEGEGVVTEEDFAHYVVSAEQAISREHTMWGARRLRARGRPQE